MQIGRFFSLGQGRVGQLLSPRVLVVRSPFQSASVTGKPLQFCCFGFASLRQAQKFLRSLHHLDLSAKLRQSKLLSVPYEVVVGDRVDLAQTLAQWERHPASSAAKLAVVSIKTDPKVAA